MTLASLAELAVSRDEGPPLAARRYTSAPAVAAAKTADADGSAAPTPASGIGVLISAIPTEVVALYTAWVLGTADSFRRTADNLPAHTTAKDAAGLLKELPTQTGHEIGLRIAVFAAGALSVIFIVARTWAKKAPKIVGSTTVRGRRLPLPEMIAGVGAFAVWALAMPDGLLGRWIHAADIDTVSLGVVTIGALSLIGLGYGVLKQPSGAAAKT